ncbi:C-reactive protein isoform X2 [Cricetulus griseus]|uniref:C-reactive protein isoform X2 n=1 Tax=Cricetulus griseus TaxID=10029 RepID=A0A9J7H0L9_CRIGR|nr:C-reactive protein isoform X2 [Cricetulus griseus]XP_035310294.1 C-reactive protein isoform X2 [Cricetulus griseus]
MEKLLWCSLVLISLSQTFAQKDMSKMAFVFPKESDNSYVSLEAQTKKPLKAFTVCLHIYTELSTTQQINTVYVGGTLSPSVLNWQELKYNAQGDVFIKPQLWP